MRVLRLRIFLQSQNWWLWHFRLLAFRGSSRTWSSGTLMVVSDGRSSCAHDPWQRREKAAAMPCRISTLLQSVVTTCCYKLKLLCVFLTLLSAIWQFLLQVHPTPVQVTDIPGSVRSLELDMSGGFARTLGSSSLEDTAPLNSTCFFGTQRCVPYSWIWASPHLKRPSVPDHVCLSCSTSRSLLLHREGDEIGSMVSHWYTYTYYIIITYIYTHIYIYTYDIYIYVYSYTISRCM